MAYPTTLNFLGTSPTVGIQAINVTSTTQNLPLGTTVRAADSVYGEGEFIYLKGVASTIAGSCVTYDSKAATTVLTVAASVGPVAIAMSANVASQYGWYQISGAGVVSSASATTNTVCGTSATAGRLVNTTTAVMVNGMRFTSAQDAPGSGFTGVQLNRPSCSLLG